MGDKGKGRDKGKTKKAPRTVKAGRRPHEQRLLADAVRKPERPQQVMGLPLGRGRTAVARGYRKSVLLLELWGVIAWLLLGAVLLFTLLRTVVGL